VAERRNRRQPAHSRGKTRARKWGKVVLATTIVGVALLAAISFAVIGIRAFQAVGITAEAFLREMPSPDAAVETRGFRSTLIYDRNGELLYELFDPQGGRRTLVPLSEIPPYLVAATISTEDHEFYTNPGFDLRGMARAIWQNIEGNGIVSGASTITQQLVRNALFEPEERYEQSAQRKIKEIILAYRLSQKYSKDQILERYLNEIFYGNLAYGVEAAAQSYFGKHARDLTLAESTLLVGLPQSPTDYDPFRNIRAAKARQGEVLSLMVRNGYLTVEQAEATFAEQLRFAKPNTFGLQAPHFVFFVRDQLERKYGRDRLFHSGLRVYTTLDLGLQRQAEEVARSHVASLKDQNAHNAAVVTMKPATGEVLVMVGSVDFWDDKIAGQVNMAMSERQPGSTLKPFTYATAFAKKLASPGTIIVDEPVSFPGSRGTAPYRPQNPDGQFRGPVTVRRALANSLNIPALKMLNQVGIHSLIEVLHQAGVTSLNEPDRYGLALTLGSGEVKLIDLVYAYGVLANGGSQAGQPVAEVKPGHRQLEPVTILKVTDDSGAVLESYVPTDPKEILSRQVAWMITDILTDASARAEIYGANDPFKLDRPVAIKTGTTDNYQDSWAIGYTPEIVTGVWVGNSDHLPMKQVLGVTGAGQIWRTFMQRALLDIPPSAFPRPSGLAQVAFDPLTGLLPLPGQASVTDWFIEGTAPTQFNPTPTPTVTPTPTPRPTATPTPRPTATPVPSPQPSSLPRTPANVEFIVVPNLVGLSEQDARRRIDQLGLNTATPNYQPRDDVADKKFYDSIPKGHVLSHLPPAGLEVRRGTVIYLAIRKD
jgi:1A family penicillin-binding protein